MIRICCRHSCVNSWFTIIQPFQANCFKCKLYKHLDRPLSYRCSWPTFEHIRFYIAIRSPPVSIHANANAFINISDDLSVKKARRTFFCRTVFWLRLRSLILFNIKIAILYLSRFQKKNGHKSRSIIFVFDWGSVTNVKLQHSNAQTECDTTSKHIQFSFLLSALIQTLFSAFERCVEDSNQSAIGFVICPLFSYMNVTQWKTKPHIHNCVRLSHLNSHRTRKMVSHYLFTFCLMQTQNATSSFLCMKQKKTVCYCVLIRKPKYKYQNKVTIKW